MDILDRFNEIIVTSPNPVLRVFEFGAYDGYHTRMLVERLLKTGKPFEYHAFEPKTYAVKQLLTTLGEIGPVISAAGSYITAVPKAIGQIDGPVTFHETIDNQKYPGSSSIRKPKLLFQPWPDMVFNKVMVDCIRFDTYIAQSNLTGKSIDFIWCDIQGAEVDLIMGGLTTFNSVRYFYTEYVNCEHYDGEIGLPQMLELLPDFRVVEDYGVSYGDVAGGDVLLGHV